MIRLRPSHIAQISNVFLRLITLAAKLGLTLYMGRYLSLADIGAYGLVFGSVMIMTAVLGIRFDYFVSRDIVGAAPKNVLAKMRDQAVFYGLNYVVLAVVMGGLMTIDATGITNKIMIIIFLLSVVESIANVTYININSLGHPVLANLLFFHPLRIMGLAGRIGRLSRSLPAQFRCDSCCLDYWLGGKLATDFMGVEAFAMA